ncbi:MAG: glycosyltransferase [Elusimicrobia bacterium]|nr:glycosyltransferase [Elusimicrobiota bacterium]
MSGPGGLVRIVVAAYNEAKNLPRLCERIRAALRREYRLFVVNDGSRDETREVLKGLAERHPIRVLEHEENRGIAAVFLTGLRAALEGAGPDDPVVIMEGDGTSDPGALRRMLAELTGDCDVVIASRYAPGGAYRNFPPKRLLMSRAANALLRLVCRMPGVRDYTIFYRAYRAGPLKEALAEFGDRFTSAGGFACNAEMLLRLGGRIRQAREVPFVYDYGFKKGRSSMRIKDNLFSYLLLFKIFFLECGGSR